MQIPFITIAFALVYPVCLLWASWTDAMTMTIPNRLNMILAAAFVPVGCLVHLSLVDWGWHIGLAAAGLVLGMICYALRFMGGGDAKLIAAAALWFDKTGFFALLIYTALAGGVLTLGLLAVRKAFWLYAHKAPPWLQQHLEPKGDIPYGIAICVGGLFAIVQGDIWPQLTAWAA